ncbi:MAG: hypothetical protein IT320_07025 [Anaerolineae bacterium]|nr:hypothetical protein [Anaerolineae bacterium]
MQTNRLALVEDLLVDDSIVLAFEPFRFIHAEMPSVGMLHIALVFDVAQVCAILKHVAHAFRRERSSGLADIPVLIQDARNLVVAEVACDI